jgi:hypothetical protein
MDATIFLAKIWGPVILAVGLGVFISRDYYLRLYRNIEKDALAVLIFGMIAIPAGIVQIIFHNIWETFPQILVSLLGWALLVKGLAFIIAPRFVSKAGYWEAKAHLVPFGGILMLVLGAYMSWFAYIA